MGLENKVILVTGAGKGIGKAIAHRFAIGGATLALCDLNDAVADTVVEARLQGVEATGYTTDVTDQNAVRTMVNAILSKYGRIDVLINNAGIVDDARLTNMTEVQFDRVIDVNLKGTYNCIRVVAENMIERQNGVILNASSIVGIYGNFGQANYAASKAGVIGLTRSLSREIGKYGVRINAVCPGFVDTTILQGIPKEIITALEKRVPLGRLGKPEEIANVFAFLASDEASYIHGSVVEVSGGMTL